MKVVTLHGGRERSLMKRHPWVFESSIASGKADLGETVRVHDKQGRFLAWAAYSPESQIRLRAWSFDEDERIDEAFLAGRLERAVQARAPMAIASDGVRLVHGETDGLPGLVVDRYGDTLCAQFLSAAVERWKRTIVAQLLRLTGTRRFYERSDASVRSLEGLPARTGWLEGDGSTVIEIAEHGFRFEVDIATGHKTGFYLDQRDSRAFFRQLVAERGYRRVLNCFAYTGAFSVAALAGGATVVASVDSSAPALAQAERHVALNGFDRALHRTLDSDVNRTLRELIDRRESFDAIVLDPPKFAPTTAHAERAARAYKDINRLAFMLLRPGGALLTFSCSGGVGADLFHKIVAGAGLDAGVDARIHARLAAAPDHPVTVTFPEGEYLKGLALVKM